MLNNILLGFVIPWIFGLWLYTVNPKLVLTMAPFSSVISFLVNHWGIYNGLWILTPILKIKTTSTIPMDIGLFPIISCFTCYFIQKSRFHPFLWILLFSTGQTILELTAYFYGKVLYSNDWNFAGTFLSYLIPGLITYYYFCLLRKKNVFDNEKWTRP
ncbi:CBO0543 family protein [Brevibacillus reuszeri]|uniref:CBO0543 family protein n=1 Tax=Brevibacillus reuszeri TaxID=54915 RepID=UPI000CCC50E8